MADFKILGDERRLDLLQRLMAAPESLTTLGKVLGEHPAHVRYHLKLLEQAGLVELVETRPVRGTLEKIYRATARAFYYHGFILPAPRLPSANRLVLAGSHDLALELLARQASHRTRAEILTLPLGSLEGLIALRQGSADLAGCHLFDVHSGEYNRSYVRHFFPDRPMAIVTLAQREQGLIVALGNPHQIRDLPDLVRPQVRFANRNRGSGTRVWLDRQLAQLGLSPESLHGMDAQIRTDEFRTHTGVAEAVAQGRADAGIGLRAAALRFDLDFIPLFHERYDLVIHQELLTNPALAAFLDSLHSQPFRQTAGALGGYELAHSGDLVTL